MSGEAAAEALAKVLMESVLIPGPTRVSKDEAIVLTSSEAQRAADKVLAAIERGDIPGVGVLPESEIHWSEVVLGHDRVAGLTKEEHGVLSDAVHAAEEGGPDDLPCACEPVYAAVERILASRARPASVDAESEPTWLTTALDKAEQDLDHCSIQQRSGPVVSIGHVKGILLDLRRAILASGVTLAADREPHPKFTEFRDRHLQNPAVRAAYEETKARRADREPDVLRAKVEAALRHNDDEIRDGHGANRSGRRALGDELRALLAHPATDQEADQ